MKKIFVCSVLLLGACAPQHTPSMMNTSRPQVVNETTMEQVPVAKVTDGYLYNVSANYARYGNDTLHLSLAYDPASKTYNAMKAFSDLADIKGRLKKMGVRSMVGEAVKVNGTEPTLMIAYDSLSAQAPAGCRNMPGFDDGLTTREIGNYRFGCSTDAMLTKQIYRPGDLLGNEAGEPGDGRRASMVVDYYRSVTPEEAGRELERIDRGEIQQQ